MVIDWFCSLSGDAPLWHTYWAICNSISWLSFVSSGSSQAYILRLLLNFTIYTSFMWRILKLHTYSIYVEFFIILFSLFMISYFMLWLIVHHYNFLCWKVVMFTCSLLFQSEKSPSSSEHALVYWTEWSRLIFTFSVSAQLSAIFSLIMYLIRLQWSLKRKKRSILDIISLRKLELT